MTSGIFPVQTGRIPPGHAWGLIPLFMPSQFIFRGFLYDYLHFGFIFIRNKVCRNFQWQVTKKNSAHLWFIRPQPERKGQYVLDKRVWGLSGDLFLKKNWLMPLIPALWEAEVGELPEPRRRRLRGAEIAPLHSSLGNKSETPSQKKKC